MRWRDNVDICLHEFESVFELVFGPLSEDIDVMDRIQNLSLSAETTNAFGNRLKSTAKVNLLYLEKQSRSLHPTETPPPTVSVATPPQPRRIVGRRDSRSMDGVRILSGLLSETDDSD